MDKNPLDQSSKLRYIDDHDQELQEHRSDDLIDETDALSLCDLPLEAIDEASKGRENEAMKDELDDFEFGPLFRPGSKSSFFDANMCVADDIFLDGHILPLEHSISSNGRSISRSESMDHGSVSSSGFWSSSYTSSSSRSSSTGSKTRNPFHSYPSPSPKIRAGPGTRSVPNPGPKKSNSTLWEFLRMGLVRAPPDIVKARCAPGYPTSPMISRSSSCGSGAKTKKRQPLRPPLEGGGGVFGGCKFSVWAVDPVALNKSVGDGKCGGGSGPTAAVVKAEAAASSHHRTFEWLKDISIRVGVLDSV
ncbi:hypothetical protein Droror1_Dr00010780 [Drosera rotundifolia]